MGQAGSCKNCCNEQRIDARASQEPDSPGGPGIVPGEEVLSEHVGLFNEACPSERRPGRSSTYCLQRLDFSLRGTGEVGLELQSLSGAEPALVIRRVDPGSPLARAMDGGPGLCPGDVVAEVQGHGGSPQLLLDSLSGLRHSGKHISISVQQRPPSFHAELERKGDSWTRLGLSVALLRERKCILVAVVHESGLAQDWNTRNPKLCIAAGDRIVAVNECHNDAFGMYALVQGTSLGGTLRLKVEPPARAFAPSMEAWIVRATAESAKENLETL